MGFNFNTALGNGLQQMGTNGSQSVEGLATSLVSGAVSGIPVVGGIASGLINLVGGSFGGNPRVPFGATRNTAAPHRQRGYLNMTDWAEDDGLSYVGWATQAGITVEDIEGANIVSRKNSGHTWEQIVAYWRGHPETLRQDLAQYFAENPASGIEPVGTVATAQLYNTQGQGIVAQQPSTTTTASNLVNTTPKTTDNTGTIALIGGGLLVAVIVLILIFKK